MPLVAVAGSDNDPFFAVVDFSTPDQPVVTRVSNDPQFPFGAYRVAIDESRVRRKRAEKQHQQAQQQQRLTMNSGFLHGT